MKRFFALLLTLAVAAFYVACGSPKSTMGMGATSSPATMQAVSRDTKSFDAASNGEMGSADGNIMSEQQLPDGRKIIYDCTLRMEATDFAATQQALYAALRAADGYSSSTSLENDSYEDAMRRATYVYRIPADKYADFLTALGTAGNVTSQEESTQDITAEYVDVEARLKSLHTQEESLLEMLAQAGELETMLAIQNQLTEVQYRIESYTAQQRTFDNLVEYCTVTVYVNEVKHTTENKSTFDDRMGAAFRESWRDFGTGCQNFVVGVVYFLPTILVLAVLGGIAFLIVRTINRYTEARRAAVKAKQPMPAGKMQPTIAQAPTYQTVQQAEETRGGETKPE